MAYKIVRMYFDRNVPSRTVKSGLTLEEARAHCNSAETASKTATSTAARRRTQRLGPWFDGYEECRR